ncbi:related to CDP-diacylglycerol--glycerol-3-phosphate 3-phosphatidyltransferase [Saccharomycodes ludwigii]|uniref:CDP-diacylglycerol--glycerol-3-phosphate 3-phosphatidyltransferase n=1 Tax=Saccharomycodes ludwigii TaxID=36035 RepID=A0A376BB38_9ASCO|nr:hypothetical protein SCDLUD_003430 [Saccharomycodes ludwigii]KAH3900448.1 hypothetical protein SCDLUD_003430 [Saccharomycodes ludwigii]SSD61811.1 related to CDP-diacylglycerol--glycerol-3-phosphate 3-phosphatidyltransferase [Saccharomycodes ludwigii]
MYSSMVDIVKHTFQNTLQTKFYFKSGQIEVIDHPVEFYKTLKNKIAQSKDKIFMASLYLGKSEEEIIHCISKALQKNDELKVYFMVDGLRGTRESPSKCSASLLAQLVRDYGDRVDVRTYKTPAIFGLKESLVPKRFNEGFGLQHMKIYGFDDEVILSGANLSRDYFTNRQDRYYLFKLKPFADYYFNLHQMISKLSFKVLYSTNAQKYVLVWPDNNLASDPRRNKTKFLEQTSKLLQTFFKTPFGNNTTTNTLKVGEQQGTLYPTVVYPVSQFTPLFSASIGDQSTEKPSILKLLTSTLQNRDEQQLKQKSWVFTAGYFNMLPEIKHKLLSSKSAKGTVITASPHANGFFESKGVSKYLPDAYTYLSYKFLKEVSKKGYENSICLREWKRGVVNQPSGWSYHAKGIWITEPGEKEPCITVVGSSNYTKRAYKFDLESNCIIATTDKDLKKQMQAEIDNIMQYTSPVTLNTFKTVPERKVSNGVKIATALLSDKL